MHQLPLSSHQKVPFVCFKCRFGLKKPVPFRLQEYDDPDHKQRLCQYPSHRCPRCFSPMAYVGRYFKIPPHSAVKQWRKAELLWQNGWVADGYSQAPRTLRDAHNFLKQQPPKNAAD